MKKYRVYFEFNVDFECEEEDLRDAVCEWWTETIDIPFYDTEELEHSNEKV